ncbi:hypothetical protein SETIT_9G163400v2 [Setaria italica]|uniref:Uncharacterized protein n=1 Tax=Setaria italica TaxID=4555 RepID=A0A368SHE6_SETIT|nr:hypothetical protein SETIT_9G163400v2 [Setaria italica]
MTGWPVSFRICAGPLGERWCATAPTCGHTWLCWPRAASAFPPVDKVPIGADPKKSYLGRRAGNYGHNCCACNGCSRTRRAAGMEWDSLRRRWALCASDSSDQ